MIDHLVFMEGVEFLKKKIFGTWQGHKCQDPVKAKTARKSERAKEIEGER